MAIIRFNSKWRHEWSLLHFDCTRTYRTRRRRHSIPSIWMKFKYCSHNNGHWPKQSLHLWPPHTVHTHTQWVNAERLFSSFFGRGEYDWTKTRRKKHCNLREREHIEFHMLVTVYSYVHSFVCVCVPPNWPFVVAGDGLVDESLTKLLWYFVSFVFCFVFGTWFAAALLFNLI